MTFGCPGHNLLPCQNSRALSVTVLLIPCLSTVAAGCGQDNPVATPPVKADASSCVPCVLIQLWLLGTDPQGKAQHGRRQAVPPEMPLGPGVWVVVAGCRAEGDACFAVLFAPGPELQPAHRVSPGTGECQEHAGPQPRPQQVGLGQGSHLPLAMATSIHHLPSLRVSAPLREGIQGWCRFQVSLKMPISPQHRDHPQPALHQPDGPALP